MIERETFKLNYEDVEYEFKLNDKRKIEQWLERHSADKRETIVHRLDVWSINKPLHASTQS